MTGLHAAVLLAAGGSRRLGRPKQLLMRDRETLVHRAMRLAAGTAPSRLLVIVGGSAELVAPAIETLGCEIVHNADWRDGLASSLRAAGGQLDGFAGPVLVLACDQPALDDRHLTALLDGAAAAQSGAAATRYGEVSGIPVVVPGTWFAHLGINNDQGFAQRLRALPAGALVEIDAPELGLDIDTPQDVIHAIAGGWLDAGDG